MLQYWTTRYLMTLCVGLATIGVASSLWIRHSAVQGQLRTANLLAEQVADGVEVRGGRLYIDQRLPMVIDQRRGYLDLDVKPVVAVVDSAGRVVFGWPRGMSHRMMPVLQFAMSRSEAMGRVGLRGGEEFVTVRRPLKEDGTTMGWAILAIPTRGMGRNPRDMGFLVLMLGSLGLLGWGVIYVLVRNFTEPIRNVSAAAKRILARDYDIQLSRDVPEREVFELVDSFQDMAQRLRQLESLRTELLAGVTHELKTPVASISGLLQAVQAEVVSGDEAREFVDMSLKETARLQRMVEDLLDFNSFTVGAVPVNRRALDLNDLLREVTHQWAIVHASDAPDLSLHLPDEHVMAETDAVRVQQIVVNLLNNASQSRIPRATIDVRLVKDAGHARIDVQDNGMGIPEDERHLVFERFFRGAGKRHRVRGLGLGLPFSQMMARSLGGDLTLAGSSPEGSTFTLTLTLH